MYSQGWESLLQGRDSQILATIRITWRGCLNLVSGPSSRVSDAVGLVLGLITCIYNKFLVVVQLLSRVWLFATTWTMAHQASLSFTVSQSLLRFMSVESVMLSNHLILCHLLLLWPSIFPSIKVFSNESTLHHMVKVLELQLQHQWFQWIFRVDFL